VSRIWRKNIKNFFMGKEEEEEEEEEEFLTYLGFLWLD